MAKNEVKEVELPEAVLAALEDIAYDNAVLAELMETISYITGDLAGVLPVRPSDTEH